jgi:hypothetical protein
MGESAWQGIMAGQRSTTAFYFCAFPPAPSGLLRRFNSSRLVSFSAKLLPLFPRASKYFACVIGDSISAKTKAKRSGFSETLLCPAVTSLRRKI